MPLRPGFAAAPHPYLNRTATSLAGSRTCGIYFTIHAEGSILWGVRFYVATSAGVPLTYLAEAWEPGNATAIASKQVVIPPTSPGIYEAEFDDVDVGNGTKIVIDAANLVKQGSSGGLPACSYGVSVWEMSGSFYSMGYVGPQDTYMTAGYGYHLNTTTDGWIYNGHGKPTTASNRHFVAPLIRVFAESASHPPVVQDQLPSPSSSGNRGDGAIYGEVVDVDGNLDASTVVWYVNGAPAWTGAAAEAGWSGTRTPMANGYEYSFTPDTPLPAGSTITMRVVAEDSDSNVLDESWTFDTAVFLDDLDLMVISTAGGESMVATGLFPTDRAVDVHLGPAGTIDDPLCYGGLGLGYTALSLDGVTLTFASPPLDKGTVDLTVIDGLTTVQINGVEVIERVWPGKLHAMRSCFPPWMDVGPRSLDIEGEE